VTDQNKRAPSAGVSVPDPAASQARAYHHGNLREALIQAGVDILAEAGAPGLTLREAARRAGVSHNAPYRHFADKEALLAAIAEEGFRELAHDLTLARDRAAHSAQAQLEETGWAYVHFALTHPQHLQIMFGRVFADRRHYPDLDEAASQAFEVLVGVIRAGQAAQEIIPGSPRQIAVGAWAMVQGLALLLIERQAPIAVGESNGEEALVRLCLRQSYEGMRWRGLA
jgi:AcrR family transcriptional regulator